MMDFHNASSAPAKKSRGSDSTNQHLGTASNKAVNSLYSKELIYNIATILQNKVLSCRTTKENDCNSLQIYREAEKLTLQSLGQLHVKEVLS